MKFLPFLLFNLLRKKQRTFLAVLSVMITFLLLCVLAATDNSFEADTDLVGKNRLLTMNMSSWSEPLPLSYYRRLETLDHVLNVTHVTPIGGYFQDTSNMIAAFAVEGQSYLTINPEIGIPDTQKANWLGNRRGVVIGADLARRFNWQIGDQIPLQSSIWRGARGNVWDVVIEGLYRDTRTTDVAEVLFMHYDYLNEGRDFKRDTVSAYQLLIADPSLADDVALQVDALFSNSSVPTRTASELVFVRDLLAQVANMGDMVLAVSAVVFLTLLVTIASTLGQSIRERLREIAVLRIMGFSSGLLISLIVAESCLLAVIGGVLGMLSSLPIIDYVAGQRTQGFALDPVDVVAIASLIIGFGVLSGLLPGLAAVRGRPADLLRGE